MFLSLPSFCIYMYFFLSPSLPHTHTPRSLIPHSPDFSLSCVVFFSLFNSLLPVKISLLFLGLRISLIQRKALFPCFLAYIKFSLTQPFCMPHSSATKLHLVNGHTATPSGKQFIQYFSYFQI